MNDPLERPPHEPNVPPLPQENVYLLRRKHLPVLIIVALVSVVCVGITGIYTGAQLVEKNAQTQIEQLKSQYEQRLADKSAEAAQEVNRLGDVIGPLATAVQDLDDQMRKRAQVTDRVLSAVQHAAKVAEQARNRAAQMAAEQAVTRAQAEMAARAAQAANQKLDNATHSTAVAPAKPWGWWDQNHR